MSILPPEAGSVSAEDLSKNRTKPKSAEIQRERERHFRLAADSIEKCDRNFLHA